MNQYQCAKCGHLWTAKSEACPECGSSLFLKHSLPKITADNKKLADKIAVEIYAALDQLKGQWVHGGDGFLPANVVCDYHGEMKFKQYLAKAALKAIGESK